MPPALSAELDARVAAASELLRCTARDHAPAVFATSFGAEDMVLLDLVARTAAAIRVLTLDTGRLPQETHDLMARARLRYGLPIEVVVPEARALSEFVGANGTNAFYASLDLRKRCCAIRKIEPLRGALAGAGAWITGLRRGQGVTRADVAPVSFDDSFGLPKIAPLADWDDAAVWDYLRARQVPWNALHDQGYPSIGCAPCTRAVEPGEDPRAGRWWWEQPEHKECGLHRRPAQVAIIAPPRVETQGVGVAS